METTDSAQSSLNNSAGATLVVNDSADATLVVNDSADATLVTSDSAETTLNGSTAAHVKDSVNTSVVDDKMDVTKNKEDEHDLYSYTKLNDFTSEIFKIELRNLPNYVGHGQLRRLLNFTLCLNPRKIKPLGNPPYIAFITFKDEEDRDKALKALDGYFWRGKNLTAKRANPAADPMARKRKEGNSEDCPDSKKSKVDDTPIEEKLKDVVTPYWNISYDVQLEKKQDEIHKFLMKLSKGIQKVNINLKSQLSIQRNKYFHQCCELSPIVPSPCTTGYRNKCEFTIGKHLHTKEKTVGFRLNAYKEGSMSVAEPDNCVNISGPMLRAVKSFQAYIRESDMDVYNPENHSGYWRQLTVRTSNNFDILLVVVIHPQSLPEDALEEEKLKLKKYFEEGPGSSCSVTSVYVHLFSKKAAHEDTAGLTHLMGKKFLEETLLGLKFQISPEAFFQINVPAAELLYTIVTNLVGKNSSNATVLDVCCGTGSITLCLAKAGLKVIGIEMCPEAVENARLNAELNNLPDVEFVCGKAEDVIIPTLKKLNTFEVIAIVDPPRAGLHPKVLKAIRASTQISKLIYVSCNPKAAFQNFVDLCRTPSNNYKGNAFFPIKAEVVDLFPHTPHVELVMLFERTNDIVLMPPGEKEADVVAKFADVENFDDKSAIDLIKSDTVENSTDLKSSDDGQHISQMGLSPTDKIKSEKDITSMNVKTSDDR